MEFNHTPVLLNECISGLNIRRGGVYVDGTLGGGGHSIHIAERLSGEGMLIGIDRDGQAVAAARHTLRDYMNICTIVHGNFADMPEIMEGLNVDGADGILLDLGVSSFQLDTGGRGFSYMHDAPLDMRMDKRDNFTAYDVVNEYTSGQLNEIIFKYGEERWSKRISEFIIESRKKKPIETTLELVSIIKAAIPKGARQDGPHPAKRTFQAIRIEVNNELDILGNTIKAVADKLNFGGRLCIISFHSLEDRIVKTTFRELESPCGCPRELPVCVCGKKPIVRAVNRKPIDASDAEVEQNPRSRSAKLRIVEKI